jgi:nucleotide-binding universal stress UspA family protein/RimJ/RimL family protein N-acetyltransferase
VAKAPLTARLRDGAAIEIRPVSPADRKTLLQGFERLSPESRYRRFFGPQPELSERDLDYLTDVDHHNHEALVATDPDTGDAVGVARFVRTAGSVAEPAVVVIDDWQGRGVGSELVQALSDRAREEGVSRFEAPVLAANTNAIRLLEGLGQTTAQRAGREVELTIELPPSRQEARWPALLRHFATGTLEPARTALDLIWPRRAGSPHTPHANVIVVGTGGEPDDSATVGKAAALALSWGARVEVVGAHRLRSGDPGQLTEAVETVVQSLRDRGIAAGQQVLRGDPALALTDVATRCNARLIVVGASEREGSARRIRGRVADSVVERSPCDVLIVRDGAE